MVIGSSSVTFNNVAWCNFCNHLPASGHLTVIIEGGDGEPVRLPACTACAAKALDNKLHDQYTVVEGVD